MNVLVVVELVAIAVLVIMIVKTLILIIFAYKHYKKKPNKKRDYNPLVSILSPCYNEALTLENCIKSLSNQTYKNMEILIINDGSTDNTLEIAKRLGKKNSKIRVLDKPNGGKASALNYGLKKAKGEIVISVDGDTVFKKNTLKELVNSFSEDHEVIAVAGNVKISNKNNIITNSQSIDYLTQTNLEKRTFNELNCFQVISGCIGAFRKDKLIEIGGYSNDTIVEDMDLTISLGRNKHKIVFNPKAIAYTEAPANLNDYLKQRYRWSYGRYQVLTKHKDALLNVNYGTLGMIGLPYSLVSPFIEIIGSLISILFLVLAVMTGNLSYYLITFGFFLIAAISISIFSLHIDGAGESKTQSLYIIIQDIWFGYLINYIDIKAGISYMLGIKTKWNKLKRLGVNKLPTYQ